MCNCASSKSCKAEMGRLLGAIPLVVDRYHRDGSSGGIYTQIYMHHYTQIYAPRCREQIPDVKIGSARDEQLIGSDKIRVQLYTRWCIWTQLYLCTISCIICTAYGPDLKPKHVGPIVYLYGPNYTDLPSYGAYGVHIMDLTLCQNMWVQFYTTWCLWAQLHYVP